MIFFIYLKEFCISPQNDITLRTVQILRLDTLGDTDKKGFPPIQCIKETIIKQQIKYLLCMCKVQFIYFNNIL